MIELNAVEKVCFDALVSVRDHFTLNKKIGRERFRDILGQVSTAITHLENKKFGCPHGLHAARCSCTPEKPGRYKN